MATATDLHDRQRVAYRLSWAMNAYRELALGTADDFHLGASFHQEGHAAANARMAYNDGHVLYRSRLYRAGGVLG